jgi:hypothetical protein
MDPLYIGVGAFVLVLVCFTAMAVNIIGLCLGAAEVAQVIFRYSLYWWSRECPGPGWVLVVEVDKGNWVNRLWGKK